jgi:hypothetical protein
VFLATAKWMALDIIFPIDLGVSTEAIVGKAMRWSVAIFITNQVRVKESV